MNRPQHATMNAMQQPKSAEIRGKIELLLREKDAIQLQLDSARAQPTTMPVDKAWRAAAEGARRMKARQVMELQADLVAALKEERAAQRLSNVVRTEEETRRREYAFRRKAKELLPTALYMQIAVESAAEAARGD